MVTPGTHLLPATGRVLARPSTSLAPRILILGGGFAGVTTALELAKRCAGVLPVHITLLSAQNFFLFTPMLAEAATGAVESRHVLYPIRPLCGERGVEFGEMLVEAMDLDRRRVVARHRRSQIRQQIHYDKLALGATPNVDLVPGAAEHALTFKGVEDAVRIRNRVIDLFEAAALTDDPWVRRRLLTFVVVGAGHAGTELMAALEELARGILHRHYPSIPKDAIRLVFVGSAVLPQTATNLAAYAREQLLKRGIELEISPAQREALELGALLHDIGEIRTPEAVLQKPGPLTAEERRMVAQHPASGVDILETVPILTPALDVVGSHHERYDGGGYPNGLAAEAIPLTARIFAVVDALDAMTQDRPYRSAHPLAEALEELRREAGKRFDPRVVDAAMAIPAERWAELLGCAVVRETGRVA